VRWRRGSGRQRPAPPRLGGKSTPGVSTDGDGGGECGTRRKRRWYPYAVVAAVAACGGDGAAVVAPLSAPRVRDDFGGGGGHNAQ